MNVYDFDGTIYASDSTVDFFRYCLMRYPGLLRCAPAVLRTGGAYLLQQTSKTAFKECFFQFLRYIPHLDNTLHAFWVSHRRGIQPWYLAQRTPDDVVISASPVFLLQPICIELGITRLIASRVDPRTGLYTGHNCEKDEKVTRFREMFGNEPIDAFYSDSLNDMPMACIAKRSFRVQGNRVEPWFVPNPTALSSALLKTRRE